MTFAFNVVGTAMAMAILTSIGLTQQAQAADGGVPPSKSKLKKSYDARKEATERIDDLGKAKTVLSATGQAIHGNAARNGFTYQSGQMPRILDDLNSARKYEAAGKWVGRLTNGATLLVGCSGHVEGTDQGHCAETVASVAVGIGADAAVTSLAAGLGTAASAPVTLSYIGGQVVGNIIKDDVHELVVHQPREAFRNLEQCGFADCTSDRAIAEAVAKRRNQQATEAFQLAYKNGEPWAVRLGEEMRQSSERRLDETMRRTRNPLEMLSITSFVQDASGMGAVTGRVEDILQLEPAELVQLSRDGSIRTRMNDMRQKYVTAQERRRQQEEQARREQLALQQEQQAVGQGEWLQSLFGTVNSYIQLQNQYDSMQQGGRSDPVPGSSNVSTPASYPRQTQSSPQPRADSCRWPDCGCPPGPAVPGVVRGCK